MSQPTSDFENLFVLASPAIPIGFVLGLFLGHIDAKEESKNYHKKMTFGEYFVRTFANGVAGSLYGVMFAFFAPITFPLTATAVITSPFLYITYKFAQ